MPLYEYECPKDGTFEQMQKFSDPPLATCPRCGGPVEKLLSAPAIQFKGSGWYVTDYARKGSTDSGGSKKSEAKESKSSSTSSSDSGSSSTSSSGGGDKK